MSKENQMDGYIYGLDALIFKGKEIGLIQDDGLDWGGEDAQTVPVWSAQRRSGPVKEILSNPGTNVIEFDLIELKPENLVVVAGGTVTKDGKKWNAPAGVVTLEGPAQVKSADGSVTDVVKVSMVARPRGKFNYQEVMKVHCKMTFLVPDEKGASPYSIDFAPDEEEADLEG